MAVYFNLTIDCGRSAEAAEAIASAYEALTIPIPIAPAVTCRVDRDRLNGQERVYVWPIGWGYQTRPEYRPELLEVEATAAIRGALLDLLRECGGYRVALFGRETQDTVEFGEVIAEGDLRLPGFVFAESLLSESSTLRSQPEFSPGYRWNPDSEEAWKVLFEERYGR